MGSSKSKPALQLRNTKDNLEAIVVEGKKARVFDTTKKTRANLIHLGGGYIGEEKCGAIDVSKKSLSLIIS
jgi:hypothetical protein